MLNQLSIDELTLIICFESDLPKTLGLTFPLVCEELNTKCQSEYMWEYFVTQHFSIYKDYVKRKSSEHGSIKSGFKQLYLRRWNDTSQCIQLSATSPGFFRDMSTNVQALHSISASVTMEFWVRNDNLALQYPVIGLLTDQDWNGGFGVYGYPNTNDNSIDYFWYVHDWCQLFCSSSNEVQQGEWLHIAGTFDGVTICMYFNGKQVATNTSAHQSIPHKHNQSEYELYIGAGNKWDTTYAFEGCIAEFRIWDTCRSQNEIQKTMNRKLLGTEPGLVFYAPLDGQQESRDQTDNTIILNDLTQNNQDLHQYDRTQPYQYINYTVTIEDNEDKPVKHCNFEEGTLITDLWKAFGNEGLVNDVTLTSSDGKTVRASKWLLCVRSAWFKDQLIHLLSNPEPINLQLEEHSRLVSAMVLFLYKDLIHFEIYTTSELIELRSISEKYNLQKLRKDVERHLSHSIDDSNVFDILLIYTRDMPVSSSCWRAKAIAYLLDKSRKRKLLESEEGQRLLEHPQTLMDMLTLV
jgi:hypothetical protein